MPQGNPVRHTSTSYGYLTSGNNRKTGRVVPGEFCSFIQIILTTYIHIYFDHALLSDNQLLHRNLAVMSFSSRNSSWRVACPLCVRERA